MRSSLRIYLEHSMAAGLALLTILVIAALAPVYGRDSRSLQPERPINYPG